ALPRERQRCGREAGGARGARVGGRDAGEDGRPQVLRPARHVAARDAAAVGIRRVGLRRRARLRRLVDPRQGISESDMLLMRRIARRAEEYLRETGIADTAYFGPECEFFVFDEVAFDLGPNRAYFVV